MNFNKNKKITYKLIHISNGGIKTNENKKYVYKLQVTNNKVTKKKHTEKTPDDVEMFCSH